LDRGLATIVVNGYPGSIVVVDLESGSRREIGAGTLPNRLEWMKQGVVVREACKTDIDCSLVYYPLEGPRRVLVTHKGRGDYPGVYRFAAAAEGSRVLFVDDAPGDRSQLFDLSLDGGAPVRLGRLKNVENVEVSPDGSRAAVATADGVYLIEGKRLRRVSRERQVGTLWFSRDGFKVAFASPKAVTVLEGTQMRTLAAEGGRFESARFVAGGPELLVAGGRSVLRWNPESGARETVATGREGETILAADLLDADLFVWTQKPPASPE
jgi:hypothetical protein